jgi:hypothetical protein
MSKLVSALLEAEEVDVPAGADGTTGTRTVTLPHGVFWPDMRSNVLFVRHFYENLWGKVLHTCKPQGGLEDAVIMGTPGSEYSLCMRRVARLHRSRLCCMPVLHTC